MLNSILPIAKGLFKGFAPKGVDIFFQYGDDVYTSGTIIIYNRQTKKTFEFTSKQIEAFVNGEKETGVDENKQVI